MLPEKWLTQSLPERTLRKESMEEIVAFIGSWHPLLVHLPIGMLIMAFLLEWLARKERYAALRPAVNVVLLAGCITAIRSEEHTSELQSLIRNSYAVFCLKKKRQ